MQAIKFDSAANKFYYITYQGVRVDVNPFTGNLFFWNTNYVLKPDDYVFQTVTNNRPTTEIEVKPRVNGGGVESIWNNPVLDANGQIIERPAQTYGPRGETPRYSIDSKGNVVYGSTTEKLKQYQVINDINATCAEKIPQYDARLLDIKSEAELLIKRYQAWAKNDAEVNALYQTIPTLFSMFAGGGLPGTVAKLFSVIFKPEDKADLPQLRAQLATLESEAVKLLEKKKVCTGSNNLTDLTDLLPRSAPTTSNILLLVLLLVLLLYYIKKRKKAKRK